MTFAMASLLENLEKLFNKEQQHYDKIALLQSSSSIKPIFVNLDSSGKRPPKIWSKNYFTQESFKRTFGVDFEDRKSVV